MARVYQPPAWVQLDAGVYAGAMNRLAVAITRRDRLRGGTYRVKEAMDAIHGLFEISDGRDPYDGLPLDSDLLTASAVCWPGGRRNDAGPLQRQPAIVACPDAPLCRFTLVSRQTAQAMGALPAKDYIAHCRAVAARAASELEAGKCREDC